MSSSQEVRQLRAELLRARAAWWISLPRDRTLERKRRFVRLVEHWADGIERGRIK